MLYEFNLTQEDMYTAIQAVGLLGIAMAFRKEVRFEVRRRQQGICDSCGQPAPLQTHHIRPESLGGSSEKIENAVGLCQDCHREIDEETFRGTRYPQVHTKDKYYPQGNGI